MKITQALLVAAVAATFTSVALDASAQAQPAPAADKPAAGKPAAKQKTFASAKDAAGALADAVRSAKADEVFAVIGPDSRSWVLSGDIVADRADWKRFLEAYDKKNNLKTTDDKVILEVGDDAWPFPAPIVKGKDGKWAFDAKAGREEILNRRVGRNELDTIQTLLAVVDAQREYAAGDMDGNGFTDYAKRIRSTAGKKDGLYWPPEPGKPGSPMGALAAQAAKEGYGGKATGKLRPYHGYHYKLLMAQGKNARSGSYDYVVGGKLLGGFGVVAYPATYGSSGIMTFVVNHEGTVYQKDLGAKTAAIGGAMTQFDPDDTWRKAQ